MRREICLAVLVASGTCGAVYADDDATWAARAQLGYANPGGNTDTETPNALFHIAHVVDQWKFLFGTEGVYGATKGETTTQARVSGACGRKFSSWMTLAVLWLRNLSTHERCGRRCRIERGAFL
jgi:hypothetical protein